jgi:hypothetical protein
VNLRVNFHFTQLLEGNFAVCYKSLIFEEITPFPCFFAVGCRAFKCRFTWLWSVVGFHAAIDLSKEIETSFAVIIAV